MPTECCYSPQITHILTYICYNNLLGTGQATKTAFGPPAPHFRTILLQFFFGKHP